MFSQTTDPTIEEHKERLENIQKNIEKNKEHLQETKKKEQEVILRLYDLTHQIRKKEQELGAAKTKINHNEQKISVLSTQMHTAQSDLQEKRELLRRRIVEMYKSGGFTTLQLLLTSQSMSDFLNRSVYFEKIVGQDMGLIGEVDRRFH